MQALIDELAGQLPADRHAVLVMDRAGWHIAAKLTWPETITPLHLPSYSPALNRSSGSGCIYASVSLATACSTPSTPSSMHAATPGTPS
jgi:hypothetical protein